MTLINGASFTPSNTAQKLVVTFYFAGIFNLVFGYFLNLISVDMVAVQPVDTIDTLSDLLDNEKFRKLQVHTVGGLWHEMALKSAPVGSDEKRLYQRIPEQNYIPAEFDPEVMKDNLGILNKLVEGKSVFIFDRQGLPTIKSFMYQLTDGGHNGRLHTSKDWFGERLLVSMMSKSSRSEFVEWSRYKLRQIFESNLINHILDTASYEVEIQGSSMSHRLKFMFPEVTKPNPPPEPFFVQFFVPLFQLCCYIISFASIVLLIENIVSKINDLLRTLLD